MADHAHHELTRVAAAADRGGHLPGTLAACDDCRGLVSDLRVLAAAIPMAAIPTRPHDLYLTADDAARLRRRGWRAVVAMSAAALDAARRPLAVGLTTLGLVGLLLGSVPAVLPFADGGTAGSSGGELMIEVPWRTVDAGAPGAAGSGDLFGVASPTDGAARPRAQALKSVAALDGSALRILSMSFLVIGFGILLMSRVAAMRRGLR